MNYLCHTLKCLLVTCILGFIVSKSGLLHNIWRSYIFFILEERRFASVQFFGCYSSKFKDNFYGLAKYSYMQKLTNQSKFHFQPFFYKIDIASELNEPKPRQSICWIQKMHYIQTGRPFSLSKFLFPRMIIIIIIKGRK